MKIAVLMSTYNGGNYLDKQLESIANQTVADSIDLYIRDDGSSDCTFEIIEKWSCRIKIELIKGKNAGPAMSFWNLMTSDQIDGDYFAFCDQDDLWDQDKLEVAIQKLRNGTHLYLCNCRLIDGNNQVIKERLRDSVPTITIPKLFVSGVAQGCSMVFTNELREYILSKSVQCIPMHDIILTLYAMTFGDIYWDETPRFGYRVHSNNVVAKNNKTILEKLRTTYWNWKNSGKSSMGQVAQELLKNINNFSKSDKIFLENMSHYRSSITKRFSLAFCKKISGVSQRSLYSYRIRILLKLL